MPRRNSSKRRKAKTILRLPDLEQSKNAVLQSLAASSSVHPAPYGILSSTGTFLSGTPPPYRGYDGIETTSISAGIIEQFALGCLSCKEGSSGEN